jgi:hypothetical protein
MKSSAQLQREAQAQRAQLSATLDQLGDSLTPNHLTNELISLAKDSGVSIAKSLAESAKSNPMPALLIGAGLLMMMTKGSGHSSADLIGKAGSAIKNAVSSGASTVRDAASSVRHSAEYAVGTAEHAASDAGHKVMHAATDTGHKVMQTASDTGHKVFETVTGLRSKVSDAATSGADKARQTLHDGEAKAKHLASEAERLALQGRDQLQQLAHEQPVLMAAIGAALGAAVGAMIPVSEAERRYMGGMSAQATKAGRETASKVAEMVKSETLGDHPETKVAAVAEKILRSVTKDIAKPVA